MTRVKIGLLILGALLLGVLVGGYLFADSKPRSFLAFNRCEGTCMQLNELAGLAASVGILQFTPLLPSVVTETDKTVVLQHPSPQARLHYVVVPKRDIKNLAEVSDADREHLFDVFAVTQGIINEKKLVNYRLITNGPGYQGVTYLHFHLLAN
jgi:histidine triad (HIT) family protein